MADTDKKINSIDFNDHTRQLSPIEYLNLTKKAEQGTFPVDYLRKGLFHPTVTKDAKNRANLSQNFKKILYSDDNMEIAVNKYLHQKHRDALTILFTDNLGVSTPLTDGTYYIYTNLTHLARQLGYSNPNASTLRVKELLNDLRDTDIIFTKKNPKGKIIEEGHKLLGGYKLDTINNYYSIEIPAKTSKYHILSFAVEIPKEISQKILAIPQQMPRVKATISYLLSNKILKNGIKLGSVMEILGIDSPKQKATFKKEIEDNINILDDFNIEYDVNIKKFTLKKELGFHRAVSHQEAMESYIKEGIIKIDEKKPVVKDGFEYSDMNVIDINYLRMSFQNKYIRVKDKNYLIKDFILEEDSKQIVIVAICNDFETNIKTRLYDFESVYNKVVNYNRDYFEFVNNLNVDEIF